MEYIEVTHYGCPNPDTRSGNVTEFTVEVPEDVNYLFATGEETLAKTGYARCPNCGKWLVLQDNVEGDVPLEGIRSQMGKWSLTLDDSPPIPLEVGCWVMTERWGPAVCIGLSDTCVSIRYKAERCHDKKIIWVANGEPPWMCAYMRPADAQSRYVLAMEGPYGEG